MLRRSLLPLASRSSVGRIPLRTTSQIPSYLSSRRGFSTPQKNEPQKIDSVSNAPKPKSRVPKIVTGGIALGSVLLAAYYYGALYEYIGKQQQSIRDYTNPGIADDGLEVSPEGKDPFNQTSGINKTIPGNSSGESGASSVDADYAKRDSETHPGQGTPQDSTRVEEVRDPTAESTENASHVEGGDIPNIPCSTTSSDDVTVRPAEGSFDLKCPMVEADEQQHVTIEPALIYTSADTTSTTQDIQEVIQSDGTKKSYALLDDYYLKDNVEGFGASSSDNHEDTSSTIEDVHDGYITKDGKLVLDFLQAIHAAEQRQAEMDTQSFMEQKRAMKEKYEKELKDARVRELMYAEREALLEKELTKERVKASAALKSLQEKFEEELKTELEQKEKEVEQRLKEMQDIAKAELAAAIATEKASQIEKMAEAKLHINALCMAFYARSEEARHSHSVHKLAQGALALDDALSKGLPIEKEIEAVRYHLEGIEKDSIIALVLSSLPEDTQKYGTDTLSQLNHKFDAMKGKLRHFSLIPRGGGGILSHSLAQVASWLKVKEVDQSGEGVESLINRVENLLAQGRLCEAADTLEDGVTGSQAAAVVTDWVRRARNRAITEQALTILQAYATSISLT